jgi:preprotein translocase subunit SecY
MPELLISYAHMQIYIGGLSLLILVCTVLDLKDQVMGYLTASRGTRPDQTAPQLADALDP